MEAVDSLNLEELLDRLDSLESRGRMREARRLIQSNLHVIPLDMSAQQRARYFALTEGLSAADGPADGRLEVFRQSAAGLILSAAAVIAAIAIVFIPILPQGAHSLAFALLGAVIGYWARDPSVLAEIWSELRLDSRALDPHPLQPEDLVSRYEASEQAMVAQLVEHLDRAQVTTVQSMLDAIEKGRVSQFEMQDLLAAVETELNRLHLQNRTGPWPVKAVAVVSDDSLELGHRLKVTIPLIPLVLAYETEISLAGAGKLRASWSRLIARLANPVIRRADSQSESSL